MSATMHFKVTSIPLESDDASLNDCTAVASDGEGLVYLLTRDPPAVHVFDTEGVFRRRWSCERFVRPHGLEIDTENNMVLVVDEGLHAVLTFELDGSPRGLELGRPGVPSPSGVQWSLPTYYERYCSIRRGAPPFNRPTNAVVSPAGTIFVSDGYANASVHRFGRDGSLQLTWGSPGSEPGQFRNVHDVCLAHDGTLLVADRENDRLQRFDQDGRWIEFWDVQRPAAVVSVGDHVVVASMRWRPLDRPFREPTAIEHERPPGISIFDGTGAVVQQIGGAPMGVSPRHDAPLRAPHGLGTSADGRVYVAEMTGTYLAQCGSIPEKGERPSLLCLLPETGH